MGKKRSKRAVLFAIRGRLHTEGTSRPCEVRVLAPVRAGDREYAVRVKLTAPYRIDQEIGGATAQQAKELAFELVHRLLDKAVLRDESGQIVEVPGAPRSAPREVDDGVRGTTAIVSCVVPRDASTVRIVFDDVARADAKRWGTQAFYASIDVDRERFRLFKFTDDELEAIGATLVSRLVATSKLAPRPPTGKTDRHHPAGRAADRRGATRSSS
jgi:hypothetical protein